MAKYQKWPVVIDHVEISETTYTSAKTGKEVKGKMCKCFLMRQGLLTARPAIKTFFQGQQNSVVERYAALEGTEDENGVTTITAETIKNALAPGTDVPGEYTDPETGIVFETYGMYLLSLKTIPKDKKCKMDGRSAFIFGTLPFVEKIEGKDLPWFMALNPDGTAKTRARNGMPIIQQYVDVATEMVLKEDLLSDEKRWVGYADSEEESLRHEVSQLISSGQWKAVEALQGTSDADTDAEENADTGE